MKCSAIELRDVFREKMTWKRQVVERGVNVHLSGEDTHSPSKWIVGINHIAVGLRWIRPTSITGDATVFRTLIFLSFLVDEVWSDELMMAGDATIIS